MMWRHLAVACCVYIALVVQPSFAVGTGNPLLSPWIPGIALVVCSLWLDGPLSLIWSASVGFGVDCLSGERLGPHLISATLAACCLQLLRRNPTSYGPFSIGLLAFISISVWRIVALALREFLERHEMESFDLARVIGESFSTAMILAGIVLTFRIVTNEIGMAGNSSTTLSNRWSMLTD